MNNEQQVWLDNHIFHLLFSVRLEYRLFLEYHVAGYLCAAPAGCSGYLAAGKGEEIQAVYRFSCTCDSGKLLYRAYGVYLYGDILFCTMFYTEKQYKRAVGKSVEHHSVFRPGHYDVGCGHTADDGYSEPRI